MDYQKIYDNETAWIEDKLRRIPYAESFEPPYEEGADIALRTTWDGRKIVLTPVDVQTLRRCWVVCEWLHAVGERDDVSPRSSRYKWPGWPRDLQPTVLELFALAAFAHDMIRYGWKKMHEAWPDFMDNLEELVCERLRWPTQAFPTVARDMLDDEHPTPFLPIRDVDVPASCAGEFYELVKQFAYVTRQYQRITDYLGRLPPATLAEFQVDTTCLFHVTMQSCELSYACVMLLTWWMDSVVRHIQLKVWGYRVIRNNLGDLPMPRLLLPEERGFNLHADCVKTMHASRLLLRTEEMCRSIIVALSAEYFHIAAMSLVASGGQHRRLGAGSILRVVDPSVTQTISRMMWAKTRIFPGGRAVRPKSSLSTQ